MCLSTWCTPCSRAQLCPPANWSYFLEHKFGCVSSGLHHHRITLTSDGTELELNFTDLTLLVGWQEGSFIGAEGDGGGGDNWSYKTCKAPVKSSPSANHHPTFYRPDALPVAKPTVSKQWRETRKCIWLHCTLASCGAVYCNRSCLWVCGCVCGSVTTITRNCVHWSSPNWVCR